MDDELRPQIYIRMNQKETDELIDIWQMHDAEEWTETAFDVVREILLSRLGEFPPQDEIQEEAEETNPELDEATLLEIDESDDTEQEDLLCPYCTGSDLLVRQVGLSGDGRSIVLKRPNEYIEDAFKDEEIVGVACQNCGHVFFMLKDFVDL